MVVCRYFQQGTCRFGKNCRFEHPNPNSGGTYPNQSWVAGGGGGGGFGDGGRMQGRVGQSGKSIFNAPNNAQSQGQVHSVSEILTTISQEMGIWQSSRMWPFSCFGYTKNVPCLPGLEDWSPEEIRLKAYDANSSGTASAYQQWMSGLATEYTNMKKQLGNPDATLRSKLVSIIDSWKLNVGPDQGQSGKNSFASGTSPLNSGQSSSVFGSNASSKPVFGSSSVFGNSAPQSSTASSVFGNPGQPTNQSVFGSSQASSQSIFGNKPGQSVFGAQTQNSAQSVFGGGQTQTTGNQSVFGGGQNQMANSQSMFGAAQNPSTFSQSVFGGGQTQTSANQSAFGGVKNQTTANQSTFGSAQMSSVFGGTSNQPAGTQSVFGNNQAQLSSAQAAFGSGQAQTNVSLSMQTTQNQQNASQQAGQGPTPLTQSAFGASAQQPSAPVAFGTAASQPPGGASVFSGTSQSQSAVAQPQPQPQAPSQQASQGTTTATSASGSNFSSFSFASNTQNQTASQTGTAAQGTGLFGKPIQSSAFGSSAFGGTSQTPSDIDKNWFTPLDQLTEEEKQQFQADSFTLGHIPIRPPPIELC